MATTIQSNIKRNTKNVEDYSLWLGGLDDSQSNSDTLARLRAGYARIFLIRMPRFMEIFDNELTKRFKHLVEMGFIGVSGIGNTTMEYENLTGGYAGNKFDVPSV